MAKNIEITKPVTITVDGTTYTLQFNRNSVVSAERAGLRVDMIGEQPMTMLPLLFYAAFKMHQPKITREETDAILFDKLGGLNPALIERLAQLYSEPTKTLIRTDDYGDEKNVTISL
jgi:hypothetical protein